MHGMDNFQPQQKQFFHNRENSNSVIEADRLKDTINNGRNVKLQHLNTAQLRSMTPGTHQDNREMMIKNQNQHMHSHSQNKYQQYE